MLTKGELYIFAYDFDGNDFAHGLNRYPIGENLIGMRDS